MNEPRDRDRREGDRPSGGQSGRAGSGRPAAGGRPEASRGAARAGSPRREGGPGAPRVAGSGGPRPAGGGRPDGGGSQGARPSGTRPTGGGRPSSSGPQGDRPSTDRRTGGGSQGDRPRTERPTRGAQPGARPSSSGRPTGGGHPGTRARTDRPAGGGRPSSGGAQGDRPRTDRPTGSGHPGARPSSSGRPTGGGRPSGSGHQGSRPGSDRPTAGRPTGPGGPVRGGRPERSAEDRSAGGTWAPRPSGGSNDAAARRREAARLPLPDDVDPYSLDGEVRRALRSLTKETADRVAGHLVAAGQLLDEDPELAHQHTVAARALGGRVGLVREAVGIAAYTAGHWAEALAELRAARRMTGSDEHLPLMADCERALGRPEKALDLARSPEAAGLPPALAVELLIVASGARRDLGQADAAVVTLQGRWLDDEEVHPWTARLWYAYADALLEAGRVEEAVRWFTSVTTLDVEEETDAEERLEELLGGADEEAPHAGDSSVPDAAAGPEVRGDDEEAVPRAEVGDGVPPARDEPQEQPSTAGRPDEDVPEDPAEAVPGGLSTEPAAQPPTAPPVGRAAGVPLFQPPADTARGQGVLLGEDGGDATPADPDAR